MSTSPAVITPTSSPNAVGLALGADNDDNWAMWPGKLRRLDGASSTRKTPMSDHQWEYRIRALRMRPRFRKQLDVTPDEVMEHFEECFRSGECAYVTQFHEHQVEITIPDERQHFWSPYLNLLVEQREGGTELDGRFGPNVAVWTMFVAAYAVLGIAAGVGVMMGFSQMSLDQETTGFWLAGACVVGIALVYAVALVGQRLAGPQMSEIRGFVEQLVGADGQLSRPAPRDPGAETSAAAEAP